MRTTCRTTNLPKCFWNSHSLREWWRRDRDAARPSALPYRKILNAVPIPSRPSTATIIHRRRPAVVRAAKAVTLVVAEKPFALQTKTPGISSRRHQHAAASNLLRPRPRPWRVVRTTGARCLCSRSHGSRFIPTPAINPCNRRGRQKRNKEAKIASR